MSPRPQSQLNDLITRNAQRALADYTSREKAAGRDFNRAKLIRMVANGMPKPPKKSVENHRSLVRVALNQMLPRDPKQPPTRLWRVDFLEGLAGALEVPVYRLVHLDYEGEGKVSDANYAGELGRTVARHLTRDESRLTNRLIRDAANHPERKRLLFGMIAAVIEAKTQADAHLAVSELVAKSKAWASNQKRKASFK